MKIRIYLTHPSRCNGFEGTIGMVYENETILVFCYDPTMDVFRTKTRPGLGHKNGPGVVESIG